jgi:hypothetical protein
MNQDSSRSHSLFTITIEATEMMKANQQGEQGEDPPADSLTLTEACCSLLTERPPASPWPQHGIAQFNSGLLCL